jgi:hypothetical protein
MLKWFGGASPLTLAGGELNRQHFRVKLECTASTWTTTNPVTTSTCDNGAGNIDTMNEYRVQLTTDTYANNLSADNARSLFGYGGSDIENDEATPTATSMVSITSDSQIFTPSAPFSGGITVDVPLPTSCLNYVLVVLKKPTGSNFVKDWSFTYFNIDMPSAAQSCGR